MRPFPRCTAVAVLITAASFPGLAFAGRVGPPGGDIIGAWIKARLAQPAANDQLVADASVTGDMVAAPNSIYTALRESPYGFRGTVWSRAFSVLTQRGTPLTRPQATEAIAWDLGMTNGYARVADADHPAPDLGARWAGTQLAKAAVSEAIARKALALTGQGAYAVAANYAVAAQILADKLVCFDQSEWAGLGLRVDVLQRFMLATVEADLTDFDLIYLARLLQAELSTWRAGATTSAGRRELPTALRVARVAAAYRDMHGYSDDPCNEQGGMRYPFAATAPTDNARPMCLVAATDRAVLYWYLLTFNAQVDPAHTNFLVAPALRMRSVLRPVRPMWLGAFGQGLQAFAAHVEVVESLVADDVSDDDASRARADAYALRRLLFLCQKELDA